MMIGMVDKELIRKMVLVKGWSIRQVSRDMNIARQTVRKCLQDANPPAYNQSTPRSARVLSAEIKGIIAEWLRKDEESPPKQRHTAHRIYQRLVAEYAFTGGESTIRRHVASMRGRRREVFVPLAFELGTRAQCDWGQAQVILAGKQVTVHLFCMRLAASSDMFVMAFPHEQQEAFLEGHRLAFEFWAGIPAVVSYDNLKTAVNKILAGRDRIEQDNFIAFRSHYLFDSHFCNPRKGNEKGAVENLVGYSRRNFLVPIPEVQSLAELNAHLLDACRKNRQRRHPLQLTTVGTVFAAEQRELLRLPQYPFDCARHLSVRVNSLSMVHVDTNRYSVPSQYAYQMLSVKVYVDRIRIFQGTTLAAEHVRLSGKNQESLHFDHYLDVLARKPGAVAYARALKPDVLPPLWQQYLAALKSTQPRPEREFVHTLLLLRDTPHVEDAVQQAMEMGVCSHDAVCNLIQQRARAEAGIRPLAPADVAKLPILPVAKANTQHYNQLLKGAVH